MTRLIVLIFFAFHVPIHADSIESAFARRLMRTRRPVDVDRLRGEYDHLRVARLACGLQIARGTAPIECYDVLALERAWRVVDESHFRRRRRTLDAACASATLDLRVPEAVVKLAHVSADCVARVREARLTVAYRRGRSGWSAD